MTMGMRMMVVMIVAVGFYDDSKPPELSEHDLLH